MIGIDTPVHSSPSVSLSRNVPWLKLISIAIWFGIATGLLEGCGMLVFQNLNVERWALHISYPILWISVIVDVIFFCVLALLVGAVAYFFAKISAIRATSVLLISLATYDLLTLTGRLHSRSRILLAVGVAFAFRRWFLRKEPKALHFWKRTLPWAIAAWVLAFAGIQGGGWFRESRALAKLPEPAPNSPNILVIVVDTLRADHLSSYGYARRTSPNIDRLASEGVVFEHAISASSWTYPSHVSLVTGRPQFEHGRGKLALAPLFAPNKNIFAGYPTIGEVLQQHGYRTGAFSANRSFFVHNLGFSPGFIHFDDYFNSVPDMFARTLVGKELLRLYGKWLNKHLTAEWLPYGTNNGFRKRADEVNKEVLNWIDKTGPAHPFFAFLNYYDVHDPYGHPRSPATTPSGTTADIELYDEGIKYTDEHIGQLLQALTQRSLDKNTLVILTSDHGESLGEHDFETHGRVLYWQVIHVPLVFWYPGHIPEGTRIARPVTNMAIAATIMDLLGVDKEKFPGPALSSAWRQTGNDVHWPDPVSELAQDREVFKDDPSLDKRLMTAQTAPMKSLISDRWHLIIHKSLGRQLYDWQNDPIESNNLINTSTGQEAAANLLAGLNDDFSGKSVLQQGESNSSGKQDASLFVASDMNKSYRISVNAGSKLNIEVQPKTSYGTVAVDPVIAIADSSGRPYQSCRDLSDDHIPAPGIPDPTPNNFDDICVNSVVLSRDGGAKLEILVPGKAGSIIELIVRVGDWEGRKLKGSSYRIVAISK